MIFYISPTPWAFNPAPSATLRRSAHHCATSTGTVQPPPARYTATLSDRHSPQASAEDCYRPMLSVSAKGKYDVNHIKYSRCGCSGQPCRSQPAACEHSPRSDQVGRVAARLGHAVGGHTHAGAWPRSWHRPKSSRCSRGRGPGQSGSGQGYLRQALMPDLTRECCRRAMAPLA